MWNRSSISWNKNFYLFSQLHDRLSIWIFACKMWRLPSDDFSGITDETVSNRFWLYWYIVKVAFTIVCMHEQHTLFVTTGVLFNSYFVNITKTVWQQFAIWIIEHNIFTIDNVLKDQVKLVYECNQSTENFWALIHVRIDFRNSVTNPSKIHYQHQLKPKKT